MVGNVKAPSRVRQQLDEVVGLEFGFKRDR